MIDRFVKTIIVGLVLVSLVLVSVLDRNRGQARAQEIEGLGIVPAKVDFNDPMGSWFVYEAKPETVLNDQVAVVNLFDEPVKVELYPVDATTTKDGSFTLKEKSETTESVGGWVKGLPETVSLEAKERQILDFSLTVPRGAEPGDYLGGLVVSRAASSSAEAVGQVSSVARTGVRIYVTVPGEVKREIEVTKYEFKKVKGKLKLFLGLKNTGNVRLENLLVKLSLKNKWGLGAESKASYPQAAVMFPGKEISLELPWENSDPVLGQYDLDIMVMFGEEYRLNRRLSLWLYDWLRLLAVAVTLLGILLFRRLTAKKRKRINQERNKQRQERKKLLGLANKKEVVTNQPQEVDWLLREIRSIVREELERLAKQGKLIGGDKTSSSRTRLKTPVGIKLPRGVHSRAVANGDKKRFFFAKKKVK